jgi:hypothetical protein
LDLSSATTATFAYLARRTSTYSAGNMHVEASTDGGVTWPWVLLDSTDALPDAASNYEEINVSLPAALVGQTSVRFRFRARAATGGNLRIDDVAIAADGPVSWNRFGFTSGAGQAVEDAEAWAVPIGLHLIPSSGGVQGLQFEIALSAGLSFVSFEPALPALDDPGWHISYEPSAGGVAVVMLAEGTQGLSTVDTDSLMLIEIAILPLEGPSTRVDTLRIHRVVAATATPNGGDLFLAIDRRDHLLTVLPQAPALSLDPDTVNLGIVSEDSIAQAAVSLHNTGNAPLEVFDIYSISGLLGISPAFATIAPDSMATIAFSIDPSLYGAGTLEDWVILDHNGPTAPDTVALTGTVVSTATRGDANDDGFVDVLDLVLGVDFILGRIELPETATRLDLHPFPAGDTETDVRDLTVLAQAIARGMWPDGSLLPNPGEAVAKTHTVVGDLIVRRNEDSIGLWIRSLERLRAIHLIARIEGGAGIVPGDQIPLVHVGSPYGDLGSGSFSILAFGIESDPVAAGAPILVATLNARPEQNLKFISLMAVDGGHARRTLVAVRESSDLPDGHQVSRLEQPFPNPVDRRFNKMVHIPLAVTDAGPISLTITNVLGRSIKKWKHHTQPGKRVASWDLRSETGNLASPGLYFVTAALGQDLQTRTLTIR